MSQFDRENNEVIALVNEHHRLSRVCRTVGVVVPVEEAEQIAVQKLRSPLDDANTVSVILSICLLFVVVVTGVLALA